MSESRVLPAQRLQTLAVELFTASGVDTAEAQLTAESLVDSNLRGHDSHGLVRVAEYVEQLACGQLRSPAVFQVQRETPAMLAVDAQLGLGQVQMRRLVDRLTPKALEVGVACGTMINCGHVGRLGEWVQRLAEQGLAAMISVNDNGVLQCVAPPGGTQPRISTNPLAIGAPTSDGPLVLDISTSAVANGKITVARLAQRPCPEGWLLDADGSPTTDPAVRMADPSGSILPMGGEQGYKGFGLGLLLDVLVGGLSGGFCPPAPEGAEMTNNVLLVVWSPTHFTTSEHFNSQADELIAYVRGTRKRPNVKAIRLPGDRSNALFIQRQKEGVPVDEGTWRSLSELAQRLGVKMPE